MRYASIDIGTNTLRLLVADLDGSGGRKDGAALAPVLYESRITRLGGGYTPARGIDPAAAERTLKGLEDFRSVIDRAGGVEGVFAVATSVVRRAANSDRLVAGARRRAGVEIEVISGAEEARLSLLGVATVVGGAGPARMLVMDIGGGSTEFVVSEGCAPAGQWSMEMGVVHLSEDHLRSDPPAAGELRAIEGEVALVIEELRSGMRASGVDPGGLGPSGGVTFVGTAGTVTTLAALDLGLDAYDRDRVNNHVLTRERVGGLYRRLAALTLAERSKLPGLEKGREDLIIPGLAITIAAMDSFGFAELKVSDAGLLEGVLLDRAS
ncbi:MAG: exopolyphosphatase [Thermodesulfobacteriota bacterium]